MGQDIFLTGASGFVGSAVLEALLERGHRVHALTHRSALKEEDGRVRSFTGGMFDDTALDRAMAGCAAAIHLVGIIMEDPGKGVTFDRIHRQGTQRVVEAARRNGVKRFVQMSAAGVRPGAPSHYQKSKFAAEEIVRNSGLAWTIFQPSLIHGAGGAFLEMEVAWARGKAAPYVAMPYFGGGLLGLGGAGLLQPIWVKDVARAFTEALENPASVGKTYELGGSERVTWPQMHRMIAERATGRSRATMAIPAWFAGALTRVLPQSMLPFSRDQVVMSQEDNVADVEGFVRDFGWRPAGLGEALGEYMDKPLD